MRGMLLKILIERHRLLDHLLVQLRGIEQVEPVLLPDGKAQMGNVESGLVAGDGNDVAVVNGLTHRLCILHLPLGDEAELQSTDARLHLADFRHKLRVRLQSLVALGMLTHIVDLDGLYRRKGRIGLLDLTDDARLLIRDYPIGEIMDARGIAVDDAIIVAHVAEVVLVGRESELLLISTARKGCDGLYQCRAVELIDINDKLLLIVDLEGVSHIRHIEQLAGKIEREVGLRGLLTGIAQKSFDGNVKSGLLGIR